MRFKHTKCKNTLSLSLIIFKEFGNIIQTSFPEFNHAFLHAPVYSSWQNNSLRSRGLKCTFVSSQNVLLRHHWNHGIEQRIFWGAYWLWCCSPLNPCRYLKGSIDTWRRNSIRSKSPATSRRKLNQSTGCVIWSIWVLCVFKWKFPKNGDLTSALCQQTEDIRTQAHTQILHPLTPPLT